MSALAGALTGCAGGQADLRSALESYDPGHRISAVKRIAAEGRVALAPALVDRLDDEDVAVRLAAIAALEQLTGKRFGYKPWDPPEQRRAAVDAWRLHIRAEAARTSCTAPP